MREASANEILTINGGKSYTARITCTCGKVFSYTCGDKAVAKIICANAAAGHVGQLGHSIKSSSCK